MRILIIAATTISTSMVSHPLQATGIPTVDVVLMVQMAAAIRSNCETDPGSTITVGGISVTLDAEECAAANVLQ